jgi:hypothetical protein
VVNESGETAAEAERRRAGTPTGVRWRKIRQIYLYRRIIALQEKYF